jgi:spermidine synthase
LRPEDSADALPRAGGKHSRLVHACFFLSGLSALIYEVAWLNRIQLVMGHTVYSLATTLAAYMTGLALGALAVPRLKRSGLSPLFLYLVAELLIGVYGLGFQPLLQLVQGPYGAIVERFELSLLGLSFVQFAFCGALILVPTVLMGTTLPLLAHHLYTRADEAAEKVPTLYAVNTLGAVAGSFLAGFVILPALGYLRTIELAAGINIVLFMVAVTLAGGAGAPASFEQLVSGLRELLRPQRIPVPLTRRDSGPAAILFVSGAASMLVQVTWNRLAALSFGPSVYIFPLTTTVVLLGIVLGSLLFRRISANETASRLALVFLPAVAGVLLLVGDGALARSPLSVLDWHQDWQPGFWGFTGLAFARLCLCILPAATALGALFPAATTALTRGKAPARAAHALGAGYALNIAGLIAGALLGSFVLLPQYGVEAMGKILFVLLMACSVGLSLGFAWLPHAAVSLWVLAWIAVEIAPPYDWRLLTNGYFYNRTKKTSMEDTRSRGWKDRNAYFGAYEARLVARRDDPHATISIHDDPYRADYRAFKVNGKIDGNNTEDLATTRMLALFPLLAKADIESALVIGLGTGSTVAQTLKYPTLKRTKVIELSGAMIDFARQFFPYVDGDIWNDPRFSYENRDGRDYLEHTRETYDLIISEPSNPWVDGVASLFTQEFYESVARRLNPGGVASLWFHTYGLDCEAVLSVMTAAAQAFENLLVFRRSTDLYMVASVDPIRLKALPAALASQETELFLQTGTKGEKRSTAYEAMLRKSIVYDRPAIVRAASAINPVVNRDDNQYLRYSSGRSFASGISCQDFPGARSTDTRAYAERVTGSL